MSSIEWTDRTWQIAAGCDEVSEGCRGCYSARLCGTRLKNLPATRGLVRQTSGGRYTWTGEVRLNEQALDVPLKVKAPTTWFVGDRTDLFHPGIPEWFRNLVFATMSLCPQHTFQVLTKRPEAALPYLRGLTGAMHPAADTPTEARGWPLPNVWVGVSVENQRRADERLPVLAEIPAAVRWVSLEPLLGPLALGRYVEFLDWAVIGGETASPGHPARPMHPSWPVDAVRQLNAARVPVFFKQWGSWQPVPPGEQAERRDEAWVDAHGRAVDGLELPSRFATSGGGWFRMRRGAARRPGYDRLFGQAFKYFPGFVRRAA